MSLLQDILVCLKPRCPVCHKAKLFRPWSLDVVAECPQCHADLSKYNVGDGAAVFLMFILGFTLVPLAWILENIAHPPLWVHAVVSGILGLAMVAVLLPAVKAYIILLEYRHRPKG